MRLGWALLAVLLLEGCGGGGEPPPNVVLVSLDTVRADHLGIYGYERATSPRIDAFAAGATLYLDAVASSSWTVPTHASLFTGKFAFQHGAHTFRQAPGQPDNVHPLSLEETTLAEALGAAGFRTAAFVANDAYLTSRLHFDQGFDEYVVARVPAAQLNRRVFQWLDGQGAAPFFLFVNYMDAHRPYNTDVVTDALPRPQPDPKGNMVGIFKRQVLSQEGPVPEALRRKIIDQYDMGIANVDAALGELLERLEASGHLARGVVVITSDHGEFFGEHHLVEHSKDVYQPVLRVPLIVKGVGQEQGARVEARASSVDVPRLIAAQMPDELGERLAGLFPHGLGSHPILSENYYSRLQDFSRPRWTERFDRVRTAFYAGPYKFIHSSDGAHELYRLDEDPDEAVNLVARRPEIARRMARNLEAFQAESPFRPRPGAAGELDEEELEALRELGYL